MARLLLPAALCLALAEPALKLLTAAGPEAMGMALLGAGLVAIGLLRRVGAPLRQAEPG